jgi:hypothetical protein
MKQFMLSGLDGIACSMVQALVILADFYRRDAVCLIMKDVSRCARLYLAIRLESSINQVPRLPGDAIQSFRSCRFQILLRLSASDSEPVRTGGFKVSFDNALDAVRNTLTSVWGSSIVDRDGLFPRVRFSQAENQRHFGRSIRLCP